MVLLFLVLSSLLAIVIVTYYKHLREVLEVHAIYQNGIILIL